MELVDLYKILDYELLDKFYDKNKKNIFSIKIISLWLSITLCGSLCNSLKFKNLAL